LYGYGDGPAEEPGAICPECGRACYQVYRREGEIVGCDACVEEEDAADAEECFFRGDGSGWDGRGGVLGGRY